MLNRFFPFPVRTVLLGAALHCPLLASAQWIAPAQPQVVVVEHVDGPADAEPVSEYRYTLYTGLNMSQLTFSKKKGEEGRPDPRFRPAFDLGLRIDHLCFNKFTHYRSVGFRYSYGLYTVDFPEQDGKISVTQNRFVVPFTIGVLGEVRHAYVGVGPNIHLGAAVGGTNRLTYHGEKDTYDCSSDESSFVFGLGVEAWVAVRSFFFGVSYNRSFERFNMPEEFGDFTSNGRKMFSANVGLWF